MTTDTDAPCQSCGAPFIPVRRGECSRCGSDAGPVRPHHWINQNGRCDNGQTMDAGDEWRPVYLHPATIPPAADHAALRKALAAATPGPWFGSGGGRYVYGLTPGDEVAQCVRVRDADLIRTAVNALPDLLDERDRMLATIARVEALAQSAGDLDNGLLVWDLHAALAGEDA